MPLVMIIEDEPVLRSSMSRGLARLPDIEVIDAGLFRDAVRLLDVERPDLIVSDLDLPDGSGVEILGVLDRLGRRIPVVFVTAYLGSFRGQLPNRKDVEVYEKPLPLARLREVVLRHFKTTGAEIESPFTLADYLQLACMGRHSVRLEVVRRGEVAGAIDVYRGQVWAARAGDAQGEQAVAVLAFGTPGASTVVKRTGEDPGPRDVHKPWQHILLNAARLHDEALRDRERRPDESGELPSGIDDALGDPSLSPPSTRPGAARPPALRIVPTPAGSPAPPPVAPTPATAPPLQTSPPGALPPLPAHLASASEVAGKGGRAIGRLPPPPPLPAAPRPGSALDGRSGPPAPIGARPSLGGTSRGPAPMEPEPVLIPAAAEVELDEERPRVESTSPVASAAVEAARVEPTPVVPTPPVAPVAPASLAPARRAPTVTEAAAPEPAAPEAAAPEPAATEPAATESAAPEPLVTEPIAPAAAASTPTATEATASAPIATEPPPVASAPGAPAAEPAAPTVPPPLPGETFEGLMDRGLDAMLERDYPTAWRALRQADMLRPGVPTVLANIARLRHLGFGDET